MTKGEWENGEVLHRGQSGEPPYAGHMERWRGCNIESGNCMSSSPYPTNSLISPKYPIYCR